MSAEAPLVVGVQSGRSFNQCVQLLRLHGFTPPEYADPEQPRCLHFKPGVAPTTLASRPVTYVSVKPRDIPHFLLDGIIDVAACFNDPFYHLKDKDYSLKPLRSFLKATTPEFAVPARLCIVGRPGASLKDPQNRIIAEYEDAERIMREKGVAGSVIQGSGGGEGLICAGLADFGLMIVQTGVTLRENGLVEHLDLGEVMLNLWCNTSRPRGLAVHQALAIHATKFVRVCGPSTQINETVCALLRQRTEIAEFVVCAAGREVMHMASAEEGSFTFVVDDKLAARRRQQYLDWAEGGRALVVDSLLGTVGVSDVICETVLGQSGGGAKFEPPSRVRPHRDVDIDTLTEDEFQALPLVIKGESKEVRYAGKGLVIIKMIPTIYSFTENRAAIVDGSDKLRLRADHIFVELLRASGIEHAYLKVSDKWVLSRLVMPHPVEFRKYALPEFIPEDLSAEEIAQLPRAPPIEIIMKTFHGGTSKHRYRDMQRSCVRQSHPFFKEVPVLVEEPYPAPLVRFDWRNPLTMQNDPLLKPVDKGRAEACKVFLEQLPSYKARFDRSFDYGQVEEFFKTSIQPETERVPDEILPEPLADYFIDVKKARKTPLNTYHVLSTFLAECDIVCNDLCMFISECGSLVYGEISQDCGRFRHFDLGSLDKDVWRSGGSASNVLEKWEKLAELLEAGWQAGIPRNLAVPPGTASTLELFIGTGNPYKLGELACILQHLDIQLLPVQAMEIEEPYMTYRDNARTKALAYAAQTGGLTLGEDSGISVTALGGLPGPRSARFADYAEVDVARGLEGGLSGFEPSGRSRDEIDAANNVRLMQLMEGRQDRRAAFHVAVCLARPGKVVFETEASATGSIAEAFRGERGFGYDPIFVGDDSHDLSWAELDAVRKNLRSHRVKALKTLAKFLVDSLM